jgi:glycosyltransferase involved in cell wall biosynthesis
LNYAKIDTRVKLIQHKENKGPGQAIITSYLAGLEDDMDIVVTIGGDHQFDLLEMTSLIDPIIDGEADYIKGNRFLVDAKEVMPIKRFIGNIVLSLMTRWAAGVRTIFDTQDGFVAISKDVIDIVDWDLFWKGYGYPSDFIIKIATYGFRNKDAPRRSIYLPGEKQSQIKIIKYIRKVAPMIIKGYFWRLKNKRKMNKIRKDALSLK